MTGPDSLRLTLVFDEREAARLRSLAAEVSDPEGARYGRHLDRAALRELVLLAPEERQAVIDWIRSEGMTVVEAPGTSQQLLFVEATREQALATFGEDLRRWIENDPDNPGARRELAIPRRLAGYVQKVGGASRGSREADAYDLDAERGVRGVPASESTGAPEGLAGISPAEVRRLYDFPEAWDGSGETIALMMLGGPPDPADLHAFWRAYGIVPPRVRTVRVGPPSLSPPRFLQTLEATMTVEWAGALAPGATIVVYLIDPTVMGDPWSAFLFALIGDEVNAPTVASTSWITPERHYYRLHGPSVITGLLDQAAVLGLTFIAASGDWGTFDGVPRTIQDGRPVSDAPWPHGIFPSVEERVLSVGGTMITHQNPFTEVGWSGPPPPGARASAQFRRFASSGGFSEEVPIPSWQKPVLRPWYPRGATTPAVVPYGRGFPDVAFMASGPSVERRPGEDLSALGFNALVGGEWIDVAGGTSVSAPIWAAVVALLNQARRAEGLPRVGFVNPLLYALNRASPPAFRPITHGVSDVEMNVVNAHGRAVTHHLPGFECRPGWNPVTGLGVPVVSRLVEHVVEAGRRAASRPSGLA